VYGEVSGNPGGIRGIAVLANIEDGGIGGAAIWGRHRGTQGWTLGVAGYTSSPYGRAILGSDESTSTSGNTSYAGLFFGGVRVLGRFDVYGHKSALVNTVSYGWRDLYTVESPEVWFEDFGEGQLTNGQATITFEPIFAQTINTTVPYRVFVTHISDTPVILTVSSKTSTGFTVKGFNLDGSPANVSFDYRIVAKRLGYENIRLEERPAPEEKPILPDPVSPPDLTPSPVPEPDMTPPSMPEGTPETPPETGPSGPGGGGG